MVGSRRSELSIREGKKVNLSVLGVFVVQEFVYREGAKGAKGFFVGLC